jgi:hypothetical protein
MGGCLQLTDAGIQQAATLPRLRWLSLSYCPRISNGGLWYLAGSRKLETLDLWGTHQINDAGIHHLSNLTSLRELDLGACYGITDESLLVLAPLPSLHRLFLWSCERITDKGVSYISTAQELRHLELPEFSSISDAGLVALGEQAQKLESLRLDNLARVTNGGIANLGKCPALRSLSIGYCRQLTDEAFREIASWPSLSALKLVWLNVSDEIFQFLRHAPHLKTIICSRCKMINQATVLHWMKEMPTWSIQVES